LQARGKPTYSLLLQNALHPVQDFPITILESLQEEEDEGGFSSGTLQACEQFSAEQSINKFL
jgi:hypothetical protein